MRSRALARVVALCLLVVGLLPLRATLPGVDAHTAARDHGPVAVAASAERGRVDDAGRTTLAPAAAHTAIRMLAARRHGRLRLRILPPVARRERLMVDPSRAVTAVDALARVVRPAFPSLSNLRV